LGSSRRDRRRHTTDAAAKSARAFGDAYLDIPLRAKWILWFFTANEIDTLRSSLIDRMTVVAVEPSATRRDHSVALQPVYRRIPRAARSQYRRRGHRDDCRCYAKDRPSPD
jgi:hypothetical protein